MHRLYGIYKVYKMVSITLAVDTELKSEMDLHPEMNWSEVARQAIREKIIFLKKMEKVLENSKMTEEDAIILGRKVNKGIAKRHKELILQNPKK